MKTLKLPDPFPRGRPPKKLEWGSSAWAQDSCLVEWSTLEREWLEPPAAAAAGPSGHGTLWTSPDRAWIGVIVLAVLAFVACL